MTATIEAVAVAVAELHPGVKVISATGITVDEAIEQLYQHVNDWWNRLCFEERETMSKTAKSTTKETGPAEPLQKLLTVTDVAAILGLSKVKVYELLKQRPNGLPSVKIDGARRVQPRKLQAWIEQHSEQA